MIALLDGDIFAYRLACVLEKYEPEVANDNERACARLSEFVLNVCNSIQADETKIFLSPGIAKLFRTAIYPEYKGNRQHKVKPILLEIFRNHLVSEFNAEIEAPYEADDLLSINQTDESVIVSIDKDLLQVPGRHYNFVKHRFELINEELGIRNYLAQALTGDTTDNIIGLDRVGPVRANKLLGDYDTLVCGLRNVLSAYSKASRLDDGYTNCKLVWLSRERGQINGPPELEEAYESIQTAKRKE